MIRTRVDATSYASPSYTPLTSSFGASLALPPSHHSLSLSAPITTMLPDRPQSRESRQLDRAYIHQQQQQHSSDRECTMMEMSNPQLPSSHVWYDVTRGMKPARIARTIQKQSATMRQTKQDIEAVKALR